MVNGPRVVDLCHSLGAEVMEDYAAPAVAVAEWNDSRVSEFVEATGGYVVGIEWLEKCDETQSRVEEKDFILSTTVE